MAQPAKAAPGRPPDKGSFPLDHYAECKVPMEEYMQCMKERGMQAFRCRDEAAAYLKCRMAKNLMAEEDLEALGFRAAHARREAEAAGADEVQAERPAAQGPYVAGLGRVQAARQQQQQQQQRPAAGR